MATASAVSLRAADAPLTLDFDRATAIEWGAAAGGVAFTQYFGQQQPQSLAAGAGLLPPLAVRSDDAAVDEADADASAEMHDSRPEPVPVSILALGATGAGKSTLLARIDTAELSSSANGGTGGDGNAAAAADRAMAADSSRSVRGIAADANAYRPTAGIDFRLRVRPWSSGVAVKLQVRGHVQRKRVFRGIAYFRRALALVLIPFLTLFPLLKRFYCPSPSDVSLSSL
jgi:hypothetical protein